MTSSAFPLVLADKLATERETVALGNSERGMREVEGLSPLLTAI